MPQSVRTRAALPVEDRVPSRSSVRVAPCPQDHAGGEVELVELSADHPGFSDADYRRRRNEIARLALDHVAGQPVAPVAYTDAEHGVWRDVWRHLAPLHARYACREYLEAGERVRLDRDRVPQLADVNTMLQGLDGFQLAPVAGLVSGRMFLSYLARRTFLSTQYMRHHNAPLYTPEPDVVHELVGHASTLAHPEFMRASELFGRAALRSNDEAMTAVARLYWYSLEFGLVRERGTIKAVGAGLLSSFGELAKFEERAELWPFDAATIAATPYDPTDYQAVLFVADSFTAMIDNIERYLDKV
jgi:phenylalanine-4-hydroxylase